MVSCEVLPSANTFEGNPALSSLILSLTLLITSMGFAPYRATTTPPTTSAPSLSKIPLRAAGPNDTLAMSEILIAVNVSEATKAFSMSAMDFTYPKPRTKYSAWLISKVWAPTSLLLSFTALTTWFSPMLYWRISSGLTSIWYSWTYPPIDATSDTPLAADKAYFT